ncbi:methyltransferase [Streptomyces sp. NPDC001404]|uniref:methyltransferase n=1 Tax=Streptomyces sp. NPDC001404 TaxID=3364571 RepID=UPI0036800890
MTSNASDTSTAAGILRQANAFCDAKALLTAVELGLFTTLREGAATEPEIRQRLELHGRGLPDWLNLLAGMGLLVREDGRYGNAPGADQYLVRGEPAYIGGFLERSNRNLYPAWGRLTEALRTGLPQAGSDFFTMIENPALLGQFVNMMDALTQVLAPRLIEAYDGWDAAGSVLDVGGCRGNLVCQIVKAHPHLHGHVFDLPQMAPFFEEKAAEHGLTGRTAFHGGDFFADPLPPADIVVCGHALHDWDRDQRRALVAKAYEAVNPGGVLLVYDRMLDDEPSHVENLVISLDMLLVTEGGSEYTVAELREHALAAGFATVEDRALGDYDTLVVCRKGGKAGR